MALNFSVNVPATNSRTPKVHTFDEEFIKDFEEMWTYLSANQGHSLTIQEGQFADVAARDAWMEKAKAYGKTDDKDIHVRPVKGKNTDDSTALTFTMEHGHVVRARTEAKRKAAEDVAARKAAGEVIKRGRPRKTPGAITAE